MATILKPPQEVLDLLRIRVKYNPETGELSSGSKDNHGYIQVRIVFEGKNYGLAGHHVAWFLHHGEWPTFIIDHDDRNRSNNRIGNLKPSTFRDNAANKEEKLNGLPIGVCLFKRTGKYHAYYYVGQKRVHLGSYSTVQEAHEARKAGLETHHNLIRNA